MKCGILLLFALLLPARGAVLHAAGAGTRASFSRSGWVGARYAAMGASGEVVADDVFAIYWNPAGLTELKGRTRFSASEIQQKARKGDVSGISEQELTQFSEESGERFFVQVGISAAMLDVERNAGFFGFACSLFNGVFGLGVYSIYSPDIESRDQYGNYLGDLNYIASVGYLSYAFTLGGVASVGVSTKVLYEKIGNTVYAGVGADIGVQVYVLPFIKVGFIAQDLGSGLYPVEKYSTVRERWEFASPTLRLGIALISTTGLTVSFSGIKKLEQTSLYYGIGVEYDLMRFTTIHLGFNGSQFSAGLTLHISSVDFTYAFMFDNVDNGYNNMVSLTVLF
ncbi:MAG: hypothetical protein JXA20_06165 [Spirochaetes bacterium]|nr:hypothetical protein [Spirochaetota bacterium]